MLEIAYSFWSRKIKELFFLPFFSWAPVSSVLFENGFWFERAILGKPFIVPVEDGDSKITKTKNPKFHSLLKEPVFPLQKHQLSASAILDPLDRSFLGAGCLSLRRQNR